MIKILNEKKEQPKIYRLICNDCGCEFECESEDTHIGANGVLFVTCPSCARDIYLYDKDGITLTAHNIEFPLHFYHVGDTDGSKAVDINNAEIQKWIRELLNDAQDSNDPYGYYGMQASGNTIVSIYAYEDEYHIVVAKNYWQCTVPRQDI